MIDSAYRSLQRRVVIVYEHLSCSNCSHKYGTLDCHYCEKENTAGTSKYLLLLNTFFPSIVIKLAYTTCSVAETIYNILFFDL